MATVQSQVAAADSLLQLAYSTASVRNLAREPALFINNKWVSSTHGATLAVEDPSSGKEICRIVDASDADVDRAVAAARAAFDDGRWSNLPPNRRERIINKLADLIEWHAAEFAELEAIDNGKPVGMASAVDIPAAVDQLRYMAGWASKLGGEVIEPQSAPRGTFFSYVSREPVGVAAPARSFSMRVKCASRVHACLRTARSSIVWWRAWRRRLRSGDRAPLSIPKATWARSCRRNNSTG